jgi:hypothetical protein
MISRTEILSQDDITPYLEMFDTTQTDDLILMLRKFQKLKTDTAARELMFLIDNMLDNYLRKVNHI